MTGNQLRALREKLGMTQEEMAAALGLRTHGPGAAKSSSHVQYLENGRFEITPTVAKAVLAMANGARPGKVYGPDDVLRIRKAMGWSQLQMALALGLNTRAQVGHLESGRTKIKWCKQLVLQEIERTIPNKKQRRTK